MCMEFFVGCGTFLKEIGIEDLDCNTFSENSEPVCYAQPLVMTTEEATTMSNEDLESGQYLKQSCIANTGNNIVKIITFTITFFASSATFFQTAFCDT